MASSSLFNPQSVTSLSCSVPWRLANTAYLNNSSYLTGRCAMKKSIANPSLKSNDYLSLRLQSINYEDTCRDALKESLRTAAETTSISGRTTVKLNEQSEQLKKIHHDVDLISHNLDTSQYLINGMKSWWGSMVQLFTSPPPHQPIASLPSTISEAQDPISPLSKHPVSEVSGINKKCLLYSSSSFNFADDVEMEENLQELSGMLTELHSQAQEIGHVLKSHNHLLDDIKGKVVTNDHRMQMQKKRLDEFIQ